MKISEMIEAGYPVPKADLEKEIEKLKEWRAIYAKDGPVFMVAKTDAIIARLKDYEPKPRKPRKFAVIQTDIDRAQGMVEGYRSARKYELEADWKRNRAEYEKEYDAALLGNIYEPELRHAGQRIWKVDSHVPDVGIQESLC